MASSVSEVAKPVVVGDSSNHYDGGLLEEEFPKGFFEKNLTKKRAFYVTVFIPSVITLLYYVFLVSAQYVVEVRLLVRTIGVSERFDASEQRGGQSIIGGDSLTQDSYVVANYLESMELVSILDREIGLRKLFSNRNVDYFSRLPKSSSLEKLHRYWKSQIDIYVDGPSGIIVLTVKAFTPEDSLLIIEHAIKAADRMIEKLSERAKVQLVAHAENDVAASLAEYNSALIELQTYQNKVGILDPIAQVRLTSAVIGKLMEERLKLSVEADTLKLANVSNSARARQLERGIEAIENEIETRQNSLAGQNSNGDQLSQNLIEFARLETRRLVTEAIYKATIRNLDTAKATAIRRTTFISVFSHPLLPEESRYPKRFSSWLIFVFGFLTFWITGTLVWMSIQDHRV